MQKDCCFQFPILGYTEQAANISVSVFLLKEGQGIWGLVIAYLSRKKYVREDLCINSLLCTTSNF